MTVKTLIFFLFISVLSTSCVSDFRPEVIDPRLPDYTEEGLNTAGAYIDGIPWTSQRRISFFFIFPSGISGAGDIYIYRSDSSQNNLLAFEFGEQDFGDFEVPRTIGFHIDDSGIDVPEDLFEFKDKTIVLDGETNYGQLFLDPNLRTAQSGPDTLHRGTGLLHVRNVQHSSTDSIIISGTFGFDVEIDSVLHTVHSGRFDYTLSSSEIQTFWR